jgi:hypothetical protein
MNNFKHEMQTRTDAMRLFRTYADILQWSVNNPDVRIVKGNHDARTGVTTWNVPDWDKEREVYEAAKMQDIKRYGSN